MNTFTRKNAWNNNGTFDNADLLWYAKAVRQMQSRSLNDPTSWWFYAAIHGEFLLQPIKDPRYLYLNWTNISYIPSSAQLGTHPPQSQTNLFWDQCQHGTWFFPPWHRGYLVALENILRDIIIQLNGPTDWALPYWNYLNQSPTNSEYKIPPAFMAGSLPDGTPNPLYVPERYGPKGDNDIYVEVGEDIETSANDECQWDTIYSESATPAPQGTGNLFGYYFGGEETGFSHSNSGFGDLETNPHNYVHGMVGGQEISNGQMGLMGVPATAALDPVFFLHHANIDRMWAAWNETGQNQNPSDPNWLTGPSANGNSQFAMPLNSTGAPWYYSPEDVQVIKNLKYNGTIYSYTYDDLSLTSYDTTPPAKLQRNLFQRLTKLGAKDLEKSIEMPAKRSEELIGASKGSLKLISGNVHAAVKLNPPAWKSVERSLLKASVSKLPDEIYLQLEDVKGGNDTNFLSVYVNEKFANTISLFGLLQASTENSLHGSKGLTYKINITHIIDDLHLEGNMDVESLDVQIKTKNNIPDSDEITIGRIGLYRLGQ